MPLDPNIYPAAHVEHEVVLVHDVQLVAHNTHALDTNEYPFVQVLHEVPSQLALAQLVTVVAALTHYWHKLLALIEYPDEHVEH